MSFTSYAQNLEDVLLWRALQQVRDGFYIDVGASDPTVDSVTRAFYERGWHGINIEPVPADHARLCEARPRDINLAVAAGAGEGTIELFDVPSVRGWATTDAALAAEHEARGHEVVAATVPARTLAAICAEHVAGEIHFLKIDAEGSEGQVIRGMDLRRWRPWILIVEAITPIDNLASHGEWEPLVTGQGYSYAYFDGLNRYYLAAEHEELRSALATQPNALDDFVSYGQEAALEAARYAAAQARAAEAQAQEAEAQAQAAEAQAREAEAQAQAAEAQARAAAAELAALHASTSWRLTGPLRELKESSLRVRERVPDKPAVDAFLKSTTRRCVGPPLRWLLARPRVGPVVDRRLARIPSIDRRVRAAANVANPATARSAARAVNQVPRDLRHLPESAREVFADLKQALGSRPR